MVQTVTASMATAVFSGDGQNVVHSLLFTTYANAVLDANQKHAWVAITAFL